MEKITTIDIEASGLSNDSYPIEIGIVLPDGSSWCSLIRPKAHWQHWSAEAQSIHHISQKELIHNGKDVTEVAITLNQIVEGKTVYSDCWVLDERWLRRLYQEANIATSFRVRDILYLLKEEQFTHWEPTKQEIAKELNLKRHRATNDARILQETFYRLNTTRKLSAR
jgi:hypothetical protein